MRAGDLDRAWRVNDAVLAARDPVTRDDHRQPYHERWVWDGTPVQGAAVQVRCYHGLGDTLQFWRYLKPLRARARHVTVEVQPELLPLLRDAPGPDRLVPFDPARPLPPGPCDVEIMELPHALRSPPPPMALRVAPLPRAAPGSLIGVCWAAGGWDPRRDLPLPLLDALRPFGTLISLQRGRDAAGLLDPVGGSMNLLRTAQLIASLDVVVTVDTMVAHLAGLLRRPVWVLLQHDADWRWMAGRSDSPWYPTARLFRQARPGDWPCVMAEVAAAMRSGTSASFPGNPAAR